MEENNQNENETKSKFEQKQYEEEEKTLEQILDGIGLGWKMSIIRVQPGFASGWLETIPILPDKPIDMDYLGENHGGKTLRLQIKNPKGRIKRQIDVDIADHPKKWGKRILHPDEAEEQKRMLAPPQQDNSILIELIKQNAIPQDNSVLIELIKQMSSNNNTEKPENTLVTELMRQKESSNDNLIEFMKSQMENGNTGQKDFKNFVSMATQMKDMQDVLGINNEKEDNSMAAMGLMADKFMTSHMDIKKMELEAKIKSPNHQPETQIPELPERTGQLQTQQQQQQPQQQKSLDDFSPYEVLQKGKSIYDTMDQTGKQQMLSMLLGEPITLENRVIENEEDEDDEDIEAEDENTCEKVNQPINFTDAEKPGQQIDGNDAPRTNDTGTA